MKIIETIITVGLALGLAAIIIGILIYAAPYLGL